MLSQREQLSELTRINTEDFLTSLGLEKVRLGRKLLDALCHYPSERFARQMVKFDTLVGEIGLMAGSHQTLMGYINRLEIVGQENIPSSGPVLLLSNHPGMSDTLALFASIPRLDLRIVAAERPFLRALPNVDRQLIYVPDEPSRRMSVVRLVVSHLRQGGAILTFPAGKIEPDPTVMPGAVESLQEWSESISIFTRLVPQTQIVVVIVSGVIWEASLRHPLTRLRRRQKDRERVAAALQLLVQTLRPNFRPTNVRVAFSEPLFAGDPIVRSNPVELTRAVTERAHFLIESCQSPVKNPNRSDLGGSIAGFPAPAGKPGKV